MDSSFRASASRKALRRAAFLAAAAVVVCLAACSGTANSFGDFKNLPRNGWQSSMPLRFKPQYADSSKTYDIWLSVRHNTNYQYRNLSLTVDLVSDKRTVERKELDIELSDGYGNWTGSGFGTLYQTSVAVAQGVKPEQAKVVTVWQSMNNCQMVKNITDVGIVVSPSK